MMYADLVDMEDFRARLKDVGFKAESLMHSGDFALELEAWLESAPSESREAIGVLLNGLDKEKGLLLPEVAALVHHGRACIARNMIDRHCR